MTLEEIKLKIEFLTDLSNILKSDSLSFEELVFKKYIEFESLPKLHLYLKENGITKPKGTLYQSKDLSSIIQSSPKNVDEKILKLAHEIFKGNLRSVNKCYG